MQSQQLLDIPSIECDANKKHGIADYVNLSNESTNQRFLCEDCRNKLSQAQLLSTVSVSDFYTGYFMSNIKRKSNDQRRLEQDFQYKTKEGIDAFMGQVNSSISAILASFESELSDDILSKAKYKAQIACDQYSDLKSNFEALWNRGNPDAGDISCFAQEYHSSKQNINNLIQESKTVCKDYPDSINYLFKSSQKAYNLFQSDIKNALQVFRTQIKHALEMLQKNPTGQSISDIHLFGGNDSTKDKDYDHMLKMLNKTLPVSSSDSGSSDSGSSGSNESSSSESNDEKEQNSSSQQDGEVSADIIIDEAQENSKATEVKKVIEGAKQQSKIQQQQQSNSSSANKTVIIPEDEKKSPPQATTAVAQANENSGKSSKFSFYQEKKSEQKVAQDNEEKFKGSYFGKQSTVQKNNPAPKPIVPFTPATPEQALKNKPPSNQPSTYRSPLENQYPFDILDENSTQSTKMPDSKKFSVPQLNESNNSKNNLAEKKIENNSNNSNNNKKVNLDLVIEEVKPTSESSGSKSPQFILLSDNLFPEAKLVQQQQQEIIMTSSKQQEIQPFKTSIQENINKVLNKENDKAANNSTNNNNNTNTNNKNSNSNNNSSNNSNNSSINSNNSNNNSSKNNSNSDNNNSNNHQQNNSTNTITNSKSLNPQKPYITGNKQQFEETKQKQQGTVVSPSNTKQQLTTNKNGENSNSSNKTDVLAYRPSRFETERTVSPDFITKYPSVRKRNFDLKLVLDYTLHTSHISIKSRCLNVIPQNKSKKVGDIISVCRSKMKVWQNKQKSAECTVHHKSQDVYNLTSITNEDKSFILLSTGNKIIFYDVNQDCKEVHSIHSSGCVIHMAFIDQLHLLATAGPNLKDIQLYEIKWNIPSTPLKRTLSTDNKEIGALCYVGSNVNILVAATAKFYRLLIYTPENINQPTKIERNSGVVILSINCNTRWRYLFTGDSQGEFAIYNLNGYNRGGKQAPETLRLISFGISIVNIVPITSKNVVFFCNKESEFFGYDLQEDCVFKNIESQKRSFLYADAIAFWRERDLLVTSCEHDIIYWRFDAALKSSQHQS